MEGTTPVTLGTIIRWGRIAKYGPIYRDADKATGISSANWINWEARGRKPDTDNLIRLAGLLEIPFETLVSAPRGAAAQDAIPPSGDATSAAKQRLAYLMRTRRGTRPTNGRRPSGGRR